MKRLTKTTTKAPSLIALATVAVAGIGVAAFPGTAEACCGAVQYQPQVVQKTTLYRQEMAHPVNFWWDQNPNQRGEWDYLTPVANAYDPVPVLKQQPAYVVTPQPVVLGAPTFQMAAYQPRAQYPGLIPQTMPAYGTLAPSMPVGQPLVMVRPPIPQAQERPTMSYQQPVVIQRPAFAPMYPPRVPVSQPVMAAVAPAPRPVDMSAGVMGTPEEQPKIISRDNYPELAVSPAAPTVMK
ncbi:MAG: hypothetical protein H7831_02325 [Magnetococcus sp. WYHC-3]